MQSPSRQSRTPLASAIGLTLFGSTALAAYFFALRPWHLHWGATAAEAEEAMPGDDLVPNAGLIATRAITINVPPNAVWPWLLQMGYRRAGWYSYDRIDNDGVHVHRIIPELQRLSIGDILHTGATGGFRVEAIQPNQTLVLMIHGKQTGINADISAAYLLEALDEEQTRLIIRLRADFRGWRERLWGWLFFDFGDFLMMRKMLLGIKERAETEWRRAETNTEIG